MFKASSILYCGDHALDDAARYMAGVLRSAGLGFDYVPSDRRWTRAQAGKNYSLYVLSDYPSRYLGTEHAKRIAERVRNGAGLLMIGGWGSFTGVDGFYGRTALADILPVQCLPSDDRCQGAAAYRIAPISRSATHPSSKSEFDHFFLSSAPTLAGYNKTLLKPGADEILRIEMLRFDAPSKRAESRVQKAHIMASDPLLAAWKVGHGRAVAYCSDLAPHWSGGLVDWGKRRIKLKAAPGIHAEVGENFVRFTKELIRLALPKNFS